MKKFLAFIVCIVLICAMLPIATFAESDVLEETPPVEETLPTEEPTPETEPPDTTPILTPEPTPEEQAEVITEKIVAWVHEQLEEISVIITLLLTIFYNVRKHKALNKSIGTLNNNAVTVAESSNTAISTALTEVKGISAVVSGYKEEISALLAEVRANEEEKQKLQQALADVTAHLKTAKLANVELANEVAELLVLANIPNSKKDELYSRHLAAVGAIADAEKTEVKEDDREEA